MVCIRPARAAWKELPAPIVLRCREVAGVSIKTIAVMLKRNAIRAKSTTVEIFAVATESPRLDILIKELFKCHGYILLKTGEVRT